MTRRLLILLLALTLSGSACGAGGDSFSAEFRRQLVDRCLDAEQPEAYCTCWVDELDDRYTQEEMLRLLQETGETPQGFLDAARACRDHL